MSILHTFLVTSYCFSGAFVFLSTNPIHSIIFLILSFCCSACILILFYVDFLALIFIVIYVGAIAILFLFIVMMINVKFTSLNQNRLNPFVFGMCTFFFIISYTFFSEIFSFENIKNFSYENSFDNLNNIDCLGQILYNYFSSCFLIAGIVLLIAIIGAVILTLNFSSNRKNQLISRQLSRSVECLVLISDNSNKN
jgi:NADH-quinone oxidoreductase subunit J